MRTSACCSASTSGHAKQFVLKGAALFTLWTGKPHRATRDLDLLGFGDPGVEHVRQVFSEVLAREVADDGVHFDLTTLVVGLIREDQVSGLGTRSRLTLRLSRSRRSLISQHHNCVPTRARPSWPRRSKPWLSSVWPTAA
jgi:hypothetical protein